MNKEIEELLNELKRRKERYDYCKNNDISFSDEDYKSYLLLSYIEQLEEFKKEHLIMKQILIEHGLYETLLNDDRFINYLKEDDNK